MAMFYDITAQAWPVRATEDERFVVLDDWIWDYPGDSMQAQIMHLVASEFGESIGAALKDDCAFELSYDCDNDEARISFCSNQFGDNFGFSFLGSEIAKGLDEAIKESGTEYLEEEILAYRKMALAIIAVCDKHAADH